MPPKRTRSTVIVEPEEEPTLYTCTVCETAIGTTFEANSHPLLEVLVCRKCYKGYKTGDFSVDWDDGVDDAGFDNYCRWCVDGGDLLVCGTTDTGFGEPCHFIFCKDCIKRNLPDDKSLRHEQLSEEESRDFKWVCYVCDSGRLKPLQEAAVAALKDLNGNAKEFRMRPSIPTNANKKLKVDDGFVKPHAPNEQKTVKSSPKKDAPEKVQKVTTEESPKIPVAQPQVQRTSPVKTVPKSPIILQQPTKLQTNQSPKVQVNQPQQQPTKVQTNQSQQQSPKVQVNQPTKVQTNQPQQQSPRVQVIQPQQQPIKVQLNKFQQPPTEIQVHKSFASSRSQVNQPQQQSTKVQVNQPQQQQPTKVQVNQPQQQPAKVQVNQSMPVKSPSIQTAQDTKMQVSKSQSEEINVFQPHFTVGPTAQTPSTKNSEKLKPKSTHKELVKSKNRDSVSITKVPDPPILLSDDDLKRRIDYFRKCKETCLEELDKKFDTLFEIFTDTENSKQINKKLASIEIESLRRNRLEFERLMTNLDKFLKSN